MARKKKAQPTDPEYGLTQVQDLEGMSLEQAQAIANNIQNMDADPDKFVAQMAANAGPAKKVNTVNGDELQFNFEVNIPKEEGTSENKEEEKMAEIKYTNEDIIEALKGMSDKDRDEILKNFRSEKKEEEKDSDSKGEEDEDSWSTKTKVCVGLGIAAAATAAKLAYDHFSGEDDPAGAAEFGKDVAAFCTGL